MAFLGTTELDDIRSHFEGTLSDTCTVQYRTKAADGAGGYTTSTVTRGTAIPCELYPAGPSAGITQEALREGGGWSLDIAWDQAISVKDQVVVAGNTYEVTWVSVGQSEQLCRTASLQRLT